MQRIASLGLLLLPALFLAPACMKAPQSSGAEFSQRVAEGAPADKSAPSLGRTGGRSGPASSPAFEAEEAAPSSRDYDGAREGSGDDAIAAQTSRPGLGTAYGEHRSSSVESVEFRRAEPNSPDVMFSIRYDDVDGVRSAARTKRSRAFSDD